MTTENKLPSVESVHTLFEDINIVLAKFMDDNKDIDNNIIFPTVIRAMLVFPLDWMRNAGTSDMFVDMMNNHVNSVYTAFISNNENVEQEKNGPSD